MSDYMDARNIGYWLQRIYHDLAGSVMVYMDARSDTYWLQQIYKELTGIDLVGDQRSFDWWSEAIYRHIIGDSSGVKGTVPANVSWQLIYASRASAVYPDGGSALSVEFWIQQAQRVGLEDNIIPPVTPWYLITGLTPIGAYAGKGAASYAASKVNLPTPGTLDLTDGVVPTWNTATGWTFDAVDDYLVSALLPDQTWTVLAKYNVNMGTTSLFGMLDGGGGFYVQVNITRAQVGTNLVNNVPAHLVGTYGFAGYTPYRDGIAEPMTVAPGPYTAGIGMFIGALNVFGGPADFVNGTISSFIAFDQTLTAPQVLAQQAVMP